MATGTPVAFVAGGLVPFIVTSSRRRISHMSVVPLISNFSAADTQSVTVHLPTADIMEVDVLTSRARRSECVGGPYPPGDTDASCEFNVADLYFIKLFLSSKAQSFKTTNPIGSGAFFRVGFLFCFCSLIHSSDFSTEPFYKPTRNDGRRQLRDLQY